MNHLDFGVSCEWDMPPYFIMHMDLQSIHECMLMFHNAWIYGPIHEDYLFTFQHCVQNELQENLNSSWRLLCINNALRSMVNKTCLHSFSCALHHWLTRPVYTHLVVLLSLHHFSFSCEARTQTKWFFFFQKNTTSH